MNFEDMQSTMQFMLQNQAKHDVEIAMHSERMRELQETFKILTALLENHEERIDSADHGIDSFREDLKLQNENFYAHLRAQREDFYVNLRTQQADWEEKRAKEWADYKEQRAAEWTEYRTARAAEWAEFQAIRKSSEHLR